VIVSGRSDSLSSALTFGVASRACGDGNFKTQVFVTGRFKRFRAMKHLSVRVANLKMADCFRRNAEYSELAGVIG